MMFACLPLHQNHEIILTNYFSHYGYSEPEVTHCYHLRTNV